MWEIGLFQVQLLRAQHWASLAPWQWPRGSVLCWEKCGHGCTGGTGWFLFEVLMYLRRACWDSSCVTSPTEHLSDVRGQNQGHPGGFRPGCQESSTRGAVHRPLRCSPGQLPVSNGSLESLTLQWQLGFDNRITREQVLGSGDSPEFRLQEVGLCQCVNHTWHHCHSSFPGAVLLSLSRDQVCSYLSQQGCKNRWHE